MCNGSMFADACSCARWRHEELVKLELLSGWGHQGVLASATPKVSTAGLHQLLAIAK